MEHLDVLIVGAGISGIDAAYHLQTSCPTKSYAILEMRGAIGGTWDLFRYPGIRSDSDMFTLGFPFRPWTGDKSIADGASILAYVRETASIYGIDKQIRFHKKVAKAAWSTKRGYWTIDVVDTQTNELTQIAAKFLYACSGYYEYNEGYTPDFPGVEKFKGRIVHPQKWTEDIAYEGKRVIVIGSGATAVTLGPSLAKKAAHVTMLQRSPTYITSVPAKDKIAKLLQRVLPEQIAGDATRFKNAGLALAFYTYSRRFPKSAKNFLVGMAKRQLEGSSTSLKHFIPSYNPWDQRLCLVPDADLFRELRKGTMSMVTDHIDHFDETGIKLKSGDHLDADLIVTATGLNLKLMGGIQFEVDGERGDPQNTMIYKGMMCSDVPNFAFAVGYTNASWTLKCDLISRYVCRLINHMDKHGYTTCRPVRDPKVAEYPLLDFSSGYVQRSIDKFPKQGDVVPWRLYQNYFRDVVMIKYSKLDDGVMAFA